MKRNDLWLNVKGNYVELCFSAIETGPVFEEIEFLVAPPAPL